MPQTYYDSELTGQQIEDALEAIDGVIAPANNGKVLCIVDGKISAKSASEWGAGAVLEPLSVTANGDYTPSAGVDGYDSVHVAVPNSYSAADEGKVVSSGALVSQTSTTVTQNGTVDTTTNNSVVVNVPNSYAAGDEGKVVSSGALVTQTSRSVTVNGTYDTTENNEVVVNVQGGGAVVQPLSITQNGTYNPPSGVDGYAPVTVNVSGGGSELIGTDPPTSDIGNVGDYYIQETFSNSCMFGITISVAARDTDYNFGYWGTRDIQIVFDDGNGNEVLLKNLAVKSCKYSYENDPFFDEDGNINGSTGTYYEHVGLPGYYCIECEIPSTYLLKALKVFPRSDSTWHDYWRTFTFAQWSEERTQIGSTLLSEADLEYADWPSNEYKVFNLGNVRPLQSPTAYLYYKTAGGWVFVK